MNRDEEAKNPRSQHTCPVWLIAVRGLSCCALAIGACASNDQTSERAVASAQALQDTDDASYSHATATLRSADGSVVGRAQFRSDGEVTFVRVSAQLPTDGADEIRGLHIHANDDPSNGEGCVADPAQPASTHFVSVDGHYNPDGTSHGEHAGDMPALFVSQSGVASMSFLTDRYQSNDVVGRALILHAGADNYGNIPLGDAPDQYSPNSDAATDLTARTGNAGARFACGVVE